MLKKLLLLFGALACFALPAHAQIGTINNPAIGILNAQDSGTCSAASASLIQQLPSNAATTTVTLAGTFSATATVRRSNNGGATWTTAGTVSAAGTTSYTTAGYTHLCVDITAYTSGAVSVAILSGPGGGTGQVITTVANLAGYNTKGTIAVVTDGSSATDCTTGGGSTVVLCQYNGTTWAAVAGGGSGSPGGSANSIQYNNAGAFGGILAAGYAGVAQSLSCITGSTCTIAPEGVTMRTDSTATPAIVATDRLNGVILTNASPAATIPVAGTAPFDAGFSVLICNEGSGAATLTPTTSTINGAASQKLAAYVAANHLPPSCMIVIADGTNYDAYVVPQADANGLIPSAALANTAVVAGSYSPSNITVNAEGQITSAAVSTAHAIAVPQQCSDTSGSATAQSCTTSPTFTPAKGDEIIYFTTTANTGALTLNVNSSAADAVQKWQGTALASGDLKANIPVLMTFDGTNWQIQNIGNAPSGGSGIGTVFIMLSNSAGAAGVGASTTGYNPIALQSNFTSDNCGSAAACEAAPMPVACTAQNLFVRTSSTQSATGALTFTLYNNGSASTVVATVSAGAVAGTYSDTTHTLSVAAGDLIDYQFSNAATAAGATITGISFQCK